MVWGLSLKLKLMPAHGESCTHRHTPCDRFHTRLLQLQPNEIYLWQKHADCALPHAGPSPRTHAWTYSHSSRRGADEDRTGRFCHLFFPAATLCPTSPCYVSPTPHFGSVPHAVTLPSFSFFFFLCPAATTSLVATFLFLNPQDFSPRPQESSLGPSILLQYHLPSLHLVPSPCASFTAVSGFGGPSLTVPCHRHSQRDIMGLGWVGEIYVTCTQKLSSIFRH